MTLSSDKNWKAHVSMFVACAIWGLMAPVGKDAMANGISGLMMVTFRVSGAAICFWITSLFTKTEDIPPHDMLMLFFASMLGIIFNQCFFTLGLSMTSPVNASIITTLMPIITMILAAIFLHEPVTNKKVWGIFCGAIGAMLLILGGTYAGGPAGDIRGDILCLTAQCCFAVYLTLFKKLIQRYSVITTMKWMFTYATIVIVPFTYNEFYETAWQSVRWLVWAECLYVVVGATFFAYILMMYAQQRLRPTVVSMYNYVQPLVACIVSVAVGLGVFGWKQGIAVIFVFGGVWMVTQSKSRADIEREKALRHQPTHRADTENK